MDTRHDYIYENDVALGRLLDYLKNTEDPRNPGATLLQNTIVIFTSDNGAEKNSNVATGPFRSNKASVFEGGHRVPLLISWPKGGIAPASECRDPVGLIDFYATFAEILGADLPDLRAGEKGAEDSESLLSAWKTGTLEKRSPLFFNDHKEQKGDPAVVAIRRDDQAGQWKLFFDATLLREGRAQPFALYDLATDPMESHNRIAEPDLAGLVTDLSSTAELIRNCGGVRYARFAPRTKLTYQWGRQTISQHPGLQLTLAGTDGEATDINANGLGLVGGAAKQVDSGQALVIHFDRDVIVDSVGIVAGNGTCGGYYQVGEGSPLAIYCTDAANDPKGQQGLLSDIGLLKKGQTLRLDSTPHLGVEAAGRWRLSSLSVRPL